MRTQTSSCSAARRERSSAATAANRPPDTEAIVDLVLRLSQLGEDLNEIAELDLNPVLARPDGCVAVDVRVRVRLARPALS